MRRLYLDLDSTVWPAEDAYTVASLELFGKVFGLKEDGYYAPTSELREKFGDNYTKIFDVALSPESVGDRVLYPGVDAALSYVREMGLSITFISHNHKPAPLRKPIRDWLEKELSFPFELIVFGARNDKTAVMDADPVAWGIIEDAPCTLKKAAQKGYVTLAKLQNWNLQTVTECGIMGFDRWEDMPDIIERELDRGRTTSSSNST